MENTSITLTHLISDNKLIASVLLIVSLLVIRWLLMRLIRRNSVVDDESPRRWANTVTNITTFFIVVGLIIIWLSEIRLVALSIAAFAVAIVIATREFIQCLIGSLYLTSTRTFSVGDWIKVDTHYGEVVQSDWLSTTLLEIDIEADSYEYTGKTLVIPNSQFAGNTIHNLNFMRRYVAHTFSIVRDADNVNVVEAKDLILEKAKEYCSAFSDVAERYNSLIEKRLGIGLSYNEPSVRVTTTNLGKNQFSISIFCPTKEAVSIEQKLMADFMDYWYAALKQAKKSKEKDTDTINETSLESN